MLFPKGSPNISASVFILNVLPLSIQIDELVPVKTIFPLPLQSTIIGSIVPGVPKSNSMLFPNILSLDPLIITVPKLKVEIVELKSLNFEHFHCNLNFRHSCYIKQHKNQHCHLLSQNFD